MPTYEYFCSKCDTTIDIVHSIKEKPEFNCETCKTKLEKQIVRGADIITGTAGSIADKKESEYKKKVYDKERAYRSRKKAFGSDSVKVPVEKPDPKHIIRRGKTLGGREQIIDKQDYIKSAAKDPATVEAARRALYKAKK